MPRYHNEAHSLPLSRGPAFLKDCINIANIIQNQCECKLFSLYLLLIYNFNNYYVYRTAVLYFELQNIISIANKLVNNFNQLATLNVLVLCAFTLYHHFFSLILPFSTNFFRSFCRFPPNFKKCNLTIHEKLRVVLGEIFELSEFIRNLHSIK